MRRNQKKFLLVAITCTFVILTILLYFYKQRMVEIYVDQDCNFEIELMKGRYAVQRTVNRTVIEIEFVDKKIQDKYPEWGGTVFTIIVCVKDAMPTDSFVLDGVRYLGENERYYYGVRMPTDVNYPPDEVEIVDDYKELSRYAQSHALKSFTIIEAK